MGLDSRRCHNQWVRAETITAPTPVETEQPIGEEVAEPDVPWVVIVWKDRKSVV